MFWYFVATAAAAALVSDIALSYMIQEKKDEEKQLLDVAPANPPVPVYRKRKEAFNSLWTRGKRITHLMGRPGKPHYGTPTIDVTVDPYGGVLRLAQSEATKQSFI